MNGDELILRIVPELDEEAVARIKAELDALYNGNNNKPNDKPTKPQADPDAPVRKQRLADLKAEIDLRDLLARKETIEFQKRISQIQQEMALGRVSMQEGARLIAEQENLREAAAADAVVDYQKQIALAEELNLTLSERASIERKAFFASERAKNGFTTMSGSMTTLTSNTKDANIAFANFGRIVQDAPFGLLGISNNIDPLLNSFAQLKASAGGTGLALRAMGSAMLGPAGLIFLVGSALPTALLFAQKAMSKMSADTEDAAEKVDTFAEAIKSAANSQTNGLISSLSYAEQVEVLGKALVAVKNNILEQTLATERQVRDAEDYFRVQVEFGEMTQEQAERGLAARKAELGITIQQDIAVRDSIQTKLTDAKANLLVEQSIGRVNTQRRKSVEEINAERQAQQDYDFYMARRGRGDFSAEDSDLVKAVRETDNAFREIRGKSMQEQSNAVALVGEGEIDVTRKTILAKTQIYKAGEKVITEAMTTGAQLRAQLLVDEQQGLIDVMDLSTSLARNAFGDTKAVAIAEALVNTYVGVSRAFREYTPPLSGVIAGLQLANGLAQVNKIRNTKIGDKGGSASTSSASVSAPSLPFVNDLGLAGQVAGTITPFGASMSPSINITANLDRQGLALAVRDGEADIATRQIPFAS